MAVSREYRDFVLEQLACVGPVTAKNMFGGVGIYLHGIFFALIANDILYFKVDDSNRPDYATAGMRPFGNMQYYEVPIEVLEDREQLQAWANKAVTVAKRKRKR